MGKERDSHWISRRLKELREARTRTDASWTQERVAAELGMSKSAYLKKEALGSDHQGMTLDQLQRVATLYDMTVDQFLGANRIPVVGEIVTGGVIEPGDALLSMEPIFEIEAPSPVPSGVVGLAVIGDALRPVYGDGDVILVRPRPLAWLENAFGKQVALRLPDGRQLYKIVDQPMRGGRASLHFFNASPIEAPAVEWFGQLYLLVPADLVKRIESSESDRAPARRRGRAPVR